MKKNIINIAFIIVFIISICKVGEKLINYRKADNIYSEIIQIKDKQINKKDNSILDLSYINKDYIGWINIKNTNIDYPILQGLDNQYYLNKDINNNYLSSGSIFLDFSNNNFNDFNTIIYGHNMKNDTMFGQLDKFKDSYFAEENIINIISKYGEILKYKVFSVYVSDNSTDYLQTKFNSQNEYEIFINKIKEKSIIENKTEVTLNDKILTLSTCSDDFYNARTVVHAKLIV